jgi:hypothetical protein
MRNFQKFLLDRFYGVFSPSLYNRNRRFSRDGLPNFFPPQSYLFGAGRAAFQLPRREAT